MKIITCIFFLVLISQIYCATPSCTAYCTAYLEACTVAPAYTNQSHCEKICAAYPLGDTDNATEGALNTIGCRTYHASVANMTADPAQKADHCFHAGPSGGKTCGSPCEAYCTLMNYSCNATANNPFPDKDFCMKSCALYDPSGNESTTSGANLFCKIYHATASFGDKVHCEHAAPSGAGLCGTRCENYCMISAKTCTGNLKIYDDMTSCMAFCNGLPKNGTIADRGGNTKDCRIYHAIAANATGNATLHCPHASHSGANVCGTWCETYCDLAMATCTGTNKIFDNLNLCQTACGNLPTTGVLGATAGNSIQCRIYHLGVASQSAALADVHCGHAAPMSKDNVCGTAAPTSVTETKTGNAYALVLSTLMLVGVLLF